MGNIKRAYSVVIPSQIFHNYYDPKIGLFPAHKLIYAKYLARYKSLLVMGYKIRGKGPSKSPKLLFCILTHSTAMLVDPAPSALGGLPVNMVKSCPWPVLFFCRDFGVKLSASL